MDERLNEENRKRVLSTADLAGRKEQAGVRVPVTAEGESPQAGESAAPLLPDQETSELRASWEASI